MVAVRASGFQDCETAIALPKAAIAEFCARWKIKEFYLFGSVLRNDFRSDSDIDVMVTFSLNHGWSLFDLVGMKEELEDAFSRKVDIMTRASIERSGNSIRRKEILGTARLLYASR